ncbi:protein phosphatase [Yoonia rosea]|uniref:Protein phosphatase n=2 Tax=Yoonia rosea TaxID=287098 RepID=A0A1R3XEW0_9RHOB|nr:protein phosphatase [Yoonia rosea]
MSLRLASLSEVGPRKINEDRLDFWESDDGDLFVAVADGLGGMGSGDIASEFIIRRLRTEFSSADFSDAGLRSLGQTLHMELIKLQQERPSLDKMATTLSAGRFSNGRFRGLHCGDSRIAVARGDGVIRLTTDQTEGQRLYEAGKLTKQEYRHYPRNHILESALGAEKQPIFQTVDFDFIRGDKFYFSTDGVHDHVKLQELRNIGRRSNDPEEAIVAVKDLMTKRKPTDNYSLVVVFT